MILPDLILASIIQDTPMKLLVEILSVASYSVNSLFLIYKVLA